MSETNAAVQITLRIPGQWSHPRELLERMPSGFRLTAHTLRLPDDTELEFVPMPTDDQFPQIFESSCRQPATDEEMAIVRNYTVNIGLTGPGGSPAAALTMMRAAAAFVRAGAAGVFIDNSALSHGGGHWIEMTEDGGTDALSFAFVAIVGGEQELWTMGLHVLGLPDVAVRLADVDANGGTIIEVIRYLCRGEKQVGDGHVLADETGPRFQTLATDRRIVQPPSPLHNPYGRLQLVSIKDIAENN